MLSWARKLVRPTFPRNLETPRFLSRKPRLSRTRCRLRAWLVPLWAALGGVAPALAAPGPGPEPAPLPEEEKAGERAAQPATARAPDGETSDWTEHVRLGGGIALYYYQPTNGWDNQFLVYSNLRFDADYRPFGLHFEPRLSNEKMRPFFDGLGWIQEAYLFFGDETLKLKIGKIYKQVGLFWDNSFYGNIQVYEGLKFDPNTGFSLEGRCGRELGLRAFAQFFVVDGHTNASLVGRDTISIPGARRRSTLSGRIQPFAQLTPNARLELGFSGEHFTADLPAGERAVNRWAADAKLTWHGFGVWGEVLQQSGIHVTDFPYAGSANAEPPVAGRASSDNTYLLAGAEYGLGPVTVRYDLSVARYSDLLVEEVLHLPAVQLDLEEHVSFLAEYASWRRHSREGTSEVDESLNLTWMGHF